MSIVSDLPTMKVGDIYESKDGTKWAVTSFCTDPTITLERVWPPVAMGCRDKKFGGINGLMWEGFRKLALKSEP